MVIVEHLMPLFLLVNLLKFFELLLFLTLNLQLPIGQFQSGLRTVWVSFEYFSTSYEQINHVIMMTVLLDVNLYFAHWGR